MHKIHEEYRILKLYNQFTGDTYAKIVYNGVIVLETLYASESDQELYDMAARHMMEDARIRGRL